MTLAGHCSGLYQTIRDEGVDVAGRGALNFLGGLVQLVDDAANDETEVHIGKQPNLTDLFTTSNSSPHLLIGPSDADTRLKGRVGTYNAPPTTSAGPRLQVSVFPALGASSSLLIQADLNGVQTANAGVKQGFAFAGTYDLGGFNLTNFYGLASIPTLSDGSGLGLLTTLIGQRGGYNAGAGGSALIAVDASAFEAITPNGDPASVITRSHGYRARNQGNAFAATGYAFRAEEMSGSPACRPFQDEGAPTGDTHGNRYYANTQFGSLTGAFAGGDGVIGIANARTNPSGTPAGGGVLWGEGGELKWTDSNGFKERISPVQVAFTAGNGNNNDCAVGEATYLRVTGPSAAFTITGIAGGTPGRVLIIYNTTTQNMSFTHEDGASAAANRIRTMDAATHTSAGEAVAVLIYSGTDSRWVLCNLEG